MMGTQMTYCSMVFEFINLRRFCLFTIWWSATGLQAQNFETTDHRARNTPHSNSASVQSLAQHLCADLPDPKHKARAIYTWITANISYLDDIPDGELWATPEHIERQRPEQVLQNRTAVCQGYASLFCALAEAAGLPCEIVTGIIKNEEGKVELIGHAWVAAQVGTEWHLFDPTWGTTASRASNQYFMANPAQFILFHLPDDPVWQLLENPVTERQFRNPSFEKSIENGALAKNGPFKYRDTLAQWIALDPANRHKAAEGRVLSFNSSNDRVLFSLGQHYWGLFLGLRGLLDSLTNEAVLYDTVQIDSLWFDAQISLLNQYHSRAKSLFDRLESKERKEKAQKFYTPQDVAAMLDKLKGDMRTGMFQNLLAQMPWSALNETQLGQLRYQKKQAQAEYVKAEKKLDCNKFGGECFEISHNRSLMDIQLAQRLVRFAQELANEPSSPKHQKTISVQLNEAQQLYQQAIQHCEQMQQRPPVYAFVEERILTAKLGMVTLQTCQIRATRTALSPEMEGLLNADKLSVKKAVALTEKMAQVAHSIEDMSSKLKSVPRTWEGETLQIAQFNLQIENFTLHFNLSTLRLRMMQEEYQMAQNKKDLPKQKASLRADVGRARKSLKEAEKALDYLESSRRMAKPSTTQKRLQINKLAKNLNDFAGKL